MFILLKIFSAKNLKIFVTTTANTAVTREQIHTAGIISKTFSLPAAERKAINVVGIICSDAQFNTTNIIMSPFAVRLSKIFVCDFKFEELKFEEFILTSFSFFIASIPIGDSVIIGLN